MAARQGNDHDELLEVLQSYINELNDLLQRDHHEEQVVMNDYFELNYNRLPTMQEGRMWVNNKFDRIKLLRQMIRDIQRLLRGV